MNFCRDTNLFFIEIPLLHLSTPLSFLIVLCGRGLALQDPYVFRNHLGRFECRLCTTEHRTLPDYIGHTQGRRHQENLEKRAAMEAKLLETEAPETGPAVPTEPGRRQRIKIGRPGYKVIKQRDPETGQRSLRFEIHVPEIEEGYQPRHRFMSAFEQRKETADRKYQYLLFAAEPYETIAFRIPSWEIDKREGRFNTHWDPKTSTFSVRLSRELHGARGWRRFL